jgi:hypothetical protein
LHANGRQRAPLKKDVLPPASIASPGFCKHRGRHANSGNAAAPAFADPSQSAAICK